MNALNNQVAVVNEVKDIFDKVVVKQFGKFVPRYSEITLTIITNTTRNLATQQGRDA